MTWQGHVVLVMMWHHHRVTQGPGLSHHLPCGSCKVTMTWFQGQKSSSYHISMIWTWIAEGDDNSINEFYVEEEKSI